MGVPVPEPAPNTKLSICSIFELEARNFACKYILTARSQFRTKKVPYKKSHFLSYRLQILHGSSYGLSNQMTKYKSTKSTKVQKYKNTKVQNKKVQKSSKNGSKMVKKLSKNH